LGDLQIRCCGNSYQPSDPRHDKQDLVYKTNREKYNAVIEEVEKLTAAGRPVLVGTTSVEISQLL
jgi:preprotein translocase subunit SecA